jgi:hypothetical protein
MKVLGAVFALIGAALVGYIFSSVQLGVVTVGKVPSAIDVSYVDMVTISLTVFGIILALASIGLAVAGVVGWNSIEGKAMKVAEEVTSLNLNDTESSLHRLLKAAISDVDSPLHKTLKDEAQKAMFAGVQGMDNDTDELDDTMEDPKGEGKYDAS